MAFRTKNGTWRVLVRRSGKRVSENFPTKALAELFERKTKLGQYDLGDKKECRLTFGEFVETWMRDYAAVEVGETSRIEYEGEIRHHLVPAFGETKLTDLSQHDLLRFRAKLQETRKPKTVNNIVILAKSILSTAAKWHSANRPLIAVSPWSGIANLPIDEQDFGYWLPTERDKFLEAARFLNPKFTEACLLAVFTGMRRGEIRALGRKAVDLDRGTIGVMRNFSERTQRIHDRTKNRKLGWLPMTDQVKRMLMRRADLAPDQLIFEPDVLKGARHKLRRLANRVGVPPIRFHDLRHTFASCLIMNGVDIYTVQRLMRHSSISMTQRYAHLAPDYLQREISKIGGTVLAPFEGGDESIRQILQHNVLR